MQFSEAKEAFLNNLEKQRGYSINTTDAYRRDLDQFAEVVQVSEQTEVADIFVKGNIRKYVYWLKESGQKSKSIARKRSCLLSFGKFLVKREALSSNPVRLIYAIKIDKNIPAIITQPQMQDLGDAYEEPTPQNSEIENIKPTSVRDKLIIEFLYGSGIRVSELSNLMKSNINKHNQTMRVIGKGNKERIVPITDAALALLEEFLKENPRGVFIFDRTAKSGRKESKNYEAMSKSRRDLRNKERSLLSIRRIRQIVERELSAVSAAKKRSPHILRHSFASHLLDNGADIRVVKEMLGHSSLASTQVYTHVNIEKMLKSFKQAHPRSGQ
ncbi:MAG: tyrosine-type recombinase/integrase [Chitinivibrionia bacterium]|nr:tyrosine-type recombinase/integrase [Chitinivibrionia bacterium]